MEDKGGDDDDYCVQITMWIVAMTTMIGVVVLVWYY